LLERFRAWRKERAEKDGVPVYIIGTNKELVNIVKTVPASLEALKGIKGFGKAKIQKYGKEIIEIINIFYSKT
jgi:superfamily II DNA helicase RecQ